MHHILLIRFFKNCSYSKQSLDKPAVSTVGFFIPLQLAYLKSNFLFVT